MSALVFAGSPTWGQTEPQTAADAEQSPAPGCFTSVAGSSLQLSLWALFGSQWINIHCSSNCKERHVSVRIRSLRVKDNRKYSRRSTIHSYHDGGIRVSVQPANQGVSLRVDGAFAFDGLHVHGLAVHIKGDLVALHSDHHLVPPGVEEHGKARESDGLQVALSVYQEVLQGLLVTVQPQPGLFVALLIHYLPDVPHFAHCAFDHAESYHEGVLIRKSTRKVQPGEKKGSQQLKHEGGMGEVIANL